MGRREPVAHIAPAAGSGARPAADPHPPHRRPSWGTLPRPLTPPSSRGARRGRGLGRKEPGKGGVGAGRRGVGGGEGGSGGPIGRPAPGRGPLCGRDVCPGVRTLRPPARCGAAAEACERLEAPSRGRRSARSNWGGGGDGGGESWRAARFPLETQSFCSGGGGGGGAAGSPPGGAEAGGRCEWLWPRPGSRCWELCGGGSRCSREGAASPPWDPLASACPWQAPCPALRHFPACWEMPPTFPLSVQPLDCQMRPCVWWGASSTAPFLPRPAGLTSPAALSA
jgi:hypothetical protein